jgi:hypothetical protein
MYATDLIKNVRNVNGFESATLDFLGCRGWVHNYELRCWRQYNNA